jgi:hypothetical protein
MKFASQRNFPATQETATIQGSIAALDNHHNSHEQQKGHLSFALM